jgi:glycosyltransferase involved in cell wall biosynthesis
MKVGLIPTSPGRSVSVKHVMASVRDALATDCELVYLPPSMAFEPDAEQERLAAEFLTACDAVVGVVHPAVLRARENLGLDLPYFLLMLGTMPRGAYTFRQVVPQLTSRDALIVNSTADQALCRQFFPNAFAPIVPLAYDERAYYPLDDTTRSEARGELGLPPDARTVLYAGRLIPEKNLLGVLRVMSVLMRATPSVHLVLAGELGSFPFAEFGVSPVNFPRSLLRAAEGLSIPAERILFAGAVSPSEMRELYGIADVLINLTLHHDENFGLSQVEAMACGTPVVGTMWGGLKDTIADGETGYRVATNVTPLGVKVDWWEAANRVYSVLRDPGAQDRFRNAGPSRASRLYSPARLRERLMELLRARVNAADLPPAEPLEVSAFAEELWAVCDPTADLRPRYLRGGRSFELYRELIEPYAGTSSLTIAPGIPLSDEQILSLAVPVAVASGNRLWPEDPLYPLEAQVPSRHAGSVRKILRALSQQPVVAFREMNARHLHGSRGALASMEWMLEEGLLLRTRRLEGGIDPGVVHRASGRTLFSVNRVAFAEADFIVTG